MLHLSLLVFMEILNLFQSSNGTYVNESKIVPDVEFSLKLGDEIGLGNIANDTKDCFVYEVLNNELHLPFMKKETVPDDVKPKVDIQVSYQHALIVVTVSIHHTSNFLLIIYSSLKTKESLTIN